MKWNPNWRNYPAKIDKSLDETKTSTYYIVARPIPLTEVRRFSGPRITWLFPGQEVEMIEKSGKWLRVISYDLVTGEMHAGWVLKKYLRKW